MDGLDPYYNNYPGYEPEFTGNPETISGGAKKNKPENTKEQIQSAGALLAFDPGRLFEVTLSEPLTTSYSPASRSRTKEVPLAAYRADTRRVSIHPLGIIDRPAGVSGTSWSSMDRDGLLVRPLEIDSHAIGQLTVEKETVEPETDARHTAVRATGAGGSGSGGDSVRGNDEEELDPTEMPFLDHLEEFRWALLKSIFAITIGMVLAWFLAEEFIGTITKLAKDAELPLMVMQLMAPIMIRLKTALFMGIIITLPFVLYFLWSFISPGLYRREKKIILPFVIGGTVCFFMGASIAYFLIIPIMLKFMKIYFFPDVKTMIDINNFIGLMLKFTIAFGLIFELPLVSFVLAKIGIIKHTLMSKYRRYAIVLIFIVSGVVTPSPDPFSQIAMAIPLLFLYEASIIVARIAGKKTLI